MTIKQISNRLSSAGIEDGLFEARILCEHFLSLPYSALVTMSDAPLDSYQGYDMLFEAVEKRLTRYPLQYILGEWEFYGLPFYINEKCLIPRADTEVIVERAISILQKNDGENKLILDLCTGSGCIAAAILSRVPEAFAYCVDIDEDTAEIAQKNLTSNGFAERSAVIVGDACEDLFEEGMKFDIIISNPPYIAASDMEFLEPELNCEPRIALTDEGDGLSLIRGIMRAYKNHLKPRGCMIFEHGCGQSESAVKIAAENGMESEVIYDYGKRARGLIGKKLRHSCAEE